MQLMSEPHFQFSQCTVAMSVCDDQSRRQLRSLYVTDYIIPQAKTKLSESIFCRWSDCNALPKSVRIVHLVTLYRLTVSTYLFQADVFFILHLFF